MKANKHLIELLSRYRQLYTVREDIFQAYKIMKECFSHDCFLFLCGNGGSASDVEHIVGELMKGFLLKRNLKEKTIGKFEQMFGEEGKQLSEYLQYGLRAISLVGHPSLITAFSNDVSAETVYAQQLFTLSKKGDILCALSTSGNSKNVVRALQVAKFKGIKSIVLTGQSGGECGKLADCIIKVPETETYKVQELHLPVYHCLCSMLESHFFGDGT